MVKHSLWISAVPYSVFGGFRNLKDFSPRQKGAFSSPQILFDIGNKVLGMGSRPENL
jgi:hypothetical protein